MAENDGQGNSGANTDNPESDDDKGGQGGDQELTYDRVVEVLREQFSFDLEAHVTGLKKEAAGTAAANAGQKAQETFGKQIGGLNKQLQEAAAEVDRLKGEVRTAELAKMPEDQRKAAAELFKAEDTVRRLAQRERAVNEAARIVAADKIALELEKKGIEVDRDALLECNSPAEMNEKAADLRAEHAEKALAEAIKGSSSGNKGSDDKGSESGKKPPAASQKPGQSKGGAGASQAGKKPWEDQKGAGLERGLADALRSQREADNRGV